MWACTALLLLLSVLLPLLCSSGGSGAYDPCDAQNQYTSIAKARRVAGAAATCFDTHRCSRLSLNSPSLTAQGSGGQVIGLAFWINGALSDWDPVVSVFDNTTNTTTNTSYSLHPCTDRDYLGAVYGPSSVIVNTSTFAATLTGTNTSVNVSALPAVSALCLCPRCFGKEKWPLSARARPQAAATDPHLRPHSCGRACTCRPATSCPSWRWTSRHALLVCGLTPRVLCLTALTRGAHTQQQDTLLSYFTLSHGLDQINQSYVNKTNTSSTPTSGVGGIFGSGTPVATTTNTTNATYYYKLIPANTTVKYVSVVAFAGTGGNAVRTLPRYMRSATASETVNTGVVTQLVLIARYKTGKLYQLDWEDMGCSGCGGTRSAQCMLVGVTSSNTQAFACGQTNNTCSVYTTTTVFDKNTNSTTNNTFSPCAFGSYIGYSGTDHYGKPFKSGPQIELLRKYSVSKLASIAGNYAKYAASYAKSQVPTTPSGTNGNSLGR